MENLLFIPVAIALYLLAKSFIDMFKIAKS
jgi:glycopeptide antibiotics resistance protein